MRQERITSICNLVCALLLLATLVTLFQPYWICTDCKTHEGVDKGVSIAEYIFLPKHHEPIADDMTELYRDVYGPNYRDPATGRKFSFKPNYILPATLTVFLGSIVGIVGCVHFRRKFFLAGVPLGVGVAGILGHLNYPALQVGQNAQLHLILLVVVTVVASVSLVLGAICAIRKKSDKENRQ